MRVVVLVVVVAACGFRGGGAGAPASDGAGGDGDIVTDAIHRVDGKGSSAPDGSGSSVIDAPPPSVIFRQVNAAFGMNQGSEAVPFTDAQLAGDLVVVMVGWYKPGTVMSVGDTSNNAYALAVGPVTSAMGMETQAIYYACGIAAAAAGANTVTVKFAAGAQDPDVRIAEYGNIAASNCLDVATSASGSGTAMDVGPLDTTHAHDLLVGANTVYYVTSASDASYNDRLITSYGDLVEDLEVTAIGGYDARATQTMAGGWVMQLVAFRGL